MLKLVVYICNIKYFGNTRLKFVTSLNTEQRNFFLNIRFTVKLLSRAPIVLQALLSFKATTHLSWGKFILQPIEGQLQFFNDLESPALATRSLVPARRARTAVHPLSLPGSSVKSASIRPSSSS